jgi:hypothetical protein
MPTLPGPTLDNPTLTDMLTNFNKANVGLLGPSATSTANQIAGARGATDPRLFNMQSAGISRDTQGLQQALQASLARSGIQGSGVGLMASTALGQAGANQQAGLRANEAQMQEQRKRQDLEMLMNIIFGQSLGLATHLDQRDIQNAQIQQQRSAAMMSAVGSALGGGATLAAGCWVARAVFGEDDPRWLQAREYILNESPSWFREFYLRYGERIGEVVKGSTALRVALRPAFLCMAWRGRKMLVAAHDAAYSAVTRSV